MNTQEALTIVLKGLPEESLREILDFAAFLSFKQEQQEWQQSGRAQFALCYGPNEPDYGSVPTDPMP